MIAGCIFYTGSFAQQKDYNKVFASADTSSFKVNNVEGWQLFNSYVSAVSSDSATLELIIQRVNYIDLSIEQYLGNIKTASLIPSTEQTITYLLASDNYTVRIDGRGNCYLKFVSGSLPSTDPFVLPIKVFYKLQ